MRSVRFACLVVAIITGTVAITAMTLLLWPLLAGVTAAVCGGAVIGGELADHLAQRGPGR